MTDEGKKRIGDAVGRLIDHAAKRPETGEPAPAPAPAPATSTDNPEEAPDKPVPDEVMKDLKTRQTGNSSSSTRLRDMASDVRGKKRGATGPAEGGNAGVWQHTEVEEVLKDGVWEAAEKLPEDTLPSVRAAILGKS